LQFKGLLGPVMVAATLSIASIKVAYWSGRITGGSTVFQSWSDRPL